MADEDALGDESDLSDFEIDDQIKHELNSLMNLEFIETSSEDDDDDDEEEKEKEPEKELEKEEEEEKEEVEAEEEEERRPRGDSLERELEMMFMSQQKEAPCGAEEGASKDTGLESISDNELDGPESGECDTSDGELPDSPSIVVTVPDTPPIDHVQGVEDLSGSSDVEIVEEFQSREYFEQPQKPAREVIIETREPVPKVKEKSPTKSKDKPVEKVKKDKKVKSKKKSDSGGDSEEKRRLKLEKYMARLEMYKAKCREYMKQITKKYDQIEHVDKKTKLREQIEKTKSKISHGEGSKLKSIVKEVNRDNSPQSSTSSKFDRSSHSSRADKSPFDERGKRSSSEKERKSKHKKSKSKSRELKEHKLLYQEYLQYLQLEREKCLEATVEKPKKSKKRKTKSKSPEKRKEVPLPNKKVHRPPILSFSEFCNNRELVSPDRDTSKTPSKVKTSHDLESRKERTISVDSAATTATVRSDPVDPTDDDKELFITITDLEHQDKLKERRTIEKDKEKIESELQKDPELKSISVFTSVLFKGGPDSEGIPFLASEGRPTSPKPAEVKPKKPFIQDTGVDELYDMNDDLSNISQSSLSPSRSPVPKLHNKALLNFVDNLKERQERLRKTSPLKISKSSRSRSKSPRRERSKKRKRKHHSSISTMSPSPPPLRPRSPEPVYRKRPSPPAYLKERWKDYPSPPEHIHRMSKKDHRLPPVLVRRRSRSRSRKVHRSRSSSEERERHYHRYRSRSRSRSRTRSRSRSPRSFPVARSRSRSRSPRSFPIQKSRSRSPRSFPIQKSRSRSPPVLTMVQLSAAEKRRKLREDHERALASLRETIRKPLSNTPLSITITNHGDNYEAIRDNYDPVVMNEDSSSNSASEEPSLPPLPPEPPPPAPAPPSADKRDDLTVVTTYTSFMPLPNTNMVPPPLGYDVSIPPFGNWMPQVADMQHPNVMYPPPQIMNNYTTSAPQQHFPFMNQPPPPLPYQMMPPPCHQHYRMPTQAPVSIVSVRQEVKNKSNPIVITQISDEDEHPVYPLEGSKCKHNPLGQNNQTVQEAIDSVKKCLKNCDALKNKDPRLVQVDGRKKSPERSEVMSKYDERKVKITLNYKPRPVSDVEQTCLFEPADEQTDGKSIEVAEANKTSNDDYTEKNSKIEGIVSKLKDSINSSTSLLEETEGDSHNNLNNSFESKNPGDEPYDPFNVSDEIVDSNENAEEIKTNSPDKQNDRIHTVILKDSTPKLSESEVENINDQINKSFSFILSHSIERKRLTPTLSSIIAKKAEKQKKYELDEKLSSLSKMCLLNKERSKNKNSDLSPLIKTSQIPSAENSNTFGQSVHKSETNIDSTTYITSQSDSKSMESQDKTKNHHIRSVKTNSDKSTDMVSDPSIQMSVEKSNKIANIADKQLCEREKFNHSNSNKFDNLKESDSETCLNKIDVQNDEAQSEPSDKDLHTSTQINSIIDKHDKSKNLTSEDNSVNSNVFCKISDYNKKQDDQFESQSKSNKAMSEQELSSEKHESAMETVVSHFCNDSTKNSFKKSSRKTDKINEFSFGLNVDLIKPKDTQVTSLGKIGFVESKNQYNSERRGNPPLSIPTKGELKRFPTPERSMPKTMRTESRMSADCDESRLMKKTSPRSKEIKEVAGKKQIVEEVKPQSNTIIESILHDFDESNSFGCDFQLHKEDKTINDANVYETFSTQKESSRGQISESTDVTSLDSCLLTSNKISSEIDCRDLNPIVSLKMVKSEAHNDNCGSKNFSKSKNQNDLPHRYDTSYEESSTKAELSDESSVKPLDKETAKTQCKSKEYQNHVKLTENEKTKSVRRSQRKSKLSKYSIFDSEDEVLKNNTLETKNNNIENQPLQKSMLEENTCLDNQDKLSAKITEIEVSELKDFSSENPLDVLESCKSNNKKSNPCPLSRKSKSYISQNLPLSFDLSVDGHLIRRGFKKLRVSLHRLALQSSATRSSDKHEASFGDSSPSLNNANSDNDHDVDLVIEHTGDNSSTENACDKNASNKRPKKRVSFDLNVSEIFDDSKFSSGVEPSVDVRTERNLHYQEPAHENDKSSKNVQCCDDLSLQTLSNTTEVANEARKKFDSDTETSLSESQITGSSSEQLSNEKQLNSLSSFYQDIVKTLDSFRTSSLPQMRQRKTVVVSIPTSEEMPSAMFLDSLKKTSKESTNKLVLQDTSEKITKQYEVKGNDEENSETEPKKEKNLNKNIISKKGSIETLKSKRFDALEIHESDNDDSMILDRELSDLAKGCLDSDSNVGDDDSVLNFGIAASDDSSLDSEFDFNCKNNNSKSSTRQKNKISSPLNMKKRFIKKLRSVNVDSEINFNKNITKDESILVDKDSVRSKQNLDDDEIPQSTETNEPGFETLPDVIPPKDSVEEIKKLSDNEDIEASVLTKRKVCLNSNISVPSVSRAEKRSETLRRTSKRQKNVSKKSFIASEGVSEEIERIIHASKSSEDIMKQNSGNNDTIDLHLNEEGNKECDLQKNHATQDFERNSIEKVEIPNDNIPCVKDNESVDSPKITQNYEEPNVESNYNKKEVTSKETSVNLEEDVYHTKTAQMINHINSNNKSSPLRKTRRGKLIQPDISNQSQLVNSGDNNTIKQLDESKAKGVINEAPIVRKTRSGRIVDNASLCINEERTRSQEQTMTQEDSNIKSVISLYSDSNEANTSEIKESHTQPKTITSTDTCKTTEVLGGSVLDEDKFSEEDPRGACENFNKESKNIPADHGLDTDENEKIKVNHNLKKEIKKLEDVSSTTPVISPTKTVRKTRLSQRKLGKVLNMTKLKREMEVDSVDRAFHVKISEPSVRMTRSKKKCF